MTFYVNYETFNATSMLILRFPQLIASYAKRQSLEFPLTMQYIQGNVWRGHCAALSLIYARLFRKAESETTSMCIIVKHTYARCLLDTRRIKWIFIFNIEESGHCVLQKSKLCVVHS